MPFQPNQPKLAPSFGATQENFTYRLRNFIINDQFTIVEDMPRAKPLRMVMRAGAKGQYPVYLMRITANNYEADLELWDTEFSALAIACPKDLKNFKGVTLAFDGRRWIYICQTEGNEPISKPQQPQIDQKDSMLNQLVEFVRSQNFVDMPVTTPIIMKVADKISPGKALELIQTAKGKGLMYEDKDVYKVI